MKTFVLTDADGKPLSPSIQASVLAKYSRSPLSAVEILTTMTEEDARSFQQKWGVSYGHSSVAELATMPYCFEGVSIIASKFLEKYQRGAYSEKSTRYQVFSKDSFIMPEGAHPIIRQAAEVLYNAYERLEKPFTDYIRRKLAIIKVSDSVIKARAFDNLRYLLPAGTGTNLAVVVNARDARYMMSDLLGSPLLELQSIGKAMVEAASRIAPVFAMGAKPNSFEPPIVKLGSDWAVKRGQSGVELRWRGDPQSVQAEFWERVKLWYGMAPQKFDKHMQTRGSRPVPEIFKTVPVSALLQMDYGAFRDLQRHRRCEQFVEPLTGKYGYDIPIDFIGTEFEEVYVDAVNRNDAILDVLTKDSRESELHAQYARPLGTIHRSWFQMDLKELYYIVELRTQPQGHISYRRIAWNLFEFANKAFPELMKWCNATKPETIGLHT